MLPILNNYSKPDCSTLNVRLFRLLHYWLFQQIFSQQQTRQKNHWYLHSPRYPEPSRRLRLISIQKQHNGTWGNLKTYSHLDAQLQLRHFWDLLRRTRMRVHVHYGSFRRRYRSYVSLNILSDGSNMWCGLVLPLTRHLPVSGQKPCGICSCFVVNRSPERSTITSMKLSMSEPRVVYFWIGPCSEKRYLPSW